MKDSDFQKLNIVLVEHDKVWAYCPFHKDTIRPNLSISLLDKYYGKYKCWACNEKGRLSTIQMDKLSLSEPVIYINDKAKLSTRWKGLAKSCYDNLQKYPLLKLGLAKQLNVSIKSLDQWLVGYDGNAFTIPMFREDLVEYSPQDGFCGIQRRFVDGTKRCVTGSRLGFMYPHVYVGDYYIFICEGFSDGISVWDLGLQSISRPHCRYTDGICEIFADPLEGTGRVIIVSDNDTVGIEGAEQLQDKLSGLYCDNDEWGETKVDIDIFSFRGAKDIREYIAREGKEQVKKELLRCI